MGLVTSILATAAHIIFSAISLYLRRCLSTLKESDAEKQSNIGYRNAFLNHINILNDISSWLLPFGTMIPVMFCLIGILLRFALTDLKVLSSFLGSSVPVIFIAFICFTWYRIRHDCYVLGSLRRFTRDSDVLPV